MNVHISSDADIGPNSEIGPYSIVHPGVRVGEGSRIGSFCEIGSPEGIPLAIGPNSVIRSHTIIHGGSSFGPKLETGHFSMLLGGTIAGVNLRVGANCELHGNLRIGDYVRMHSGVHLGRGAVIGDFVWLLPNVLTANDPLPPSSIHLPNTVEALSVVCANSLLMPGVHLGFGSFVAAGSVVRTDVAAGTCVRGDPAMAFADIDRLFSGKFRIAHPWPRHFRDSLDQDGLNRAMKLGDELLEIIKAKRRLNRPEIREGAVSPANGELPRRSSTLGAGEVGGTGLELT